MTARRLDQVATAARAERVAKSKRNVAIRRAWADGYSLREIADAAGCGHSSVARICAAPLEARCQSCGDTFTPADTTDLEHLERAETGNDCGGRGVLI